MPYGTGKTTPDSLPHKRDKRKRNVAQVVYRWLSLTPYQVRGRLLVLSPPYAKSYGGQAQWERKRKKVNICWYRHNGVYA
jgi:hypothetical protein